MALHAIPLKRLIATASQAQAAIEALTPDEKTRLRGYARWRMIPISGTVHHSDEEDLYQEAIARTLDGRRNWYYAEKTMFEHLLGCISSVGDEWYSEMKLYSELSDVHRSPDTLHLEITQKIALQRIRRKLKGNATALAVLESIERGEKPSEAIERLNMPKKVYEAARHRILRLGQNVLLHRGAHQHE